MPPHFPYNTPEGPSYMCRNVCVVKAQQSYHSGGYASNEFDALYTQSTVWDVRSKPH